MKFFFFSKFGPLSSEGDKNYLSIKDLDKIFYKIMNLGMWARDIAEISENRTYAFQNGTAFHQRCPEILKTLKFWKKVKTTTGEKAAWFLAFLKF